MYLYISHLNRHILSDNIEKVEEEELTNVPPPSRGFLTNSPLPGPTRWQIPDKSRGGGGDGHAWNWLLKPLSLISFEANFSFFSLAESPSHDLQITAYKLIMVCSCTMSSNCVWLWHLAANNILLMRKRTHAFLLVWKWQIALLSEDIHVDQMIKQLLFNSVITKYRDLSLSSLWTDPPPLRKNQRRGVCDSPSLIVYGNNFTLK